MHDILLIFCLTLTLLESACDRKNVISFVTDRVEYAEAGNGICFRKLKIQVIAVYTDAGRTVDNDILDSLKCTITSFSCFDIPESYEQIILQDSSKKSMMLVNHASKIDYFEGNHHVRSRYFPNEVECFHVGNSKKNSKIEELKSISSAYFTNSRENLHCVIFYKGSESSMKITFDSREVTINYGQEFVQSLNYSSFWTDCVSLRPITLDIQNDIHILTQDYKDACLDGRTLQIDHFKIHPLECKHLRSQECNTVVAGNKIKCYLSDIVNLPAGVFKSIHRDRKTLIMDANAIQSLKFNLDPSSSPFEMESIFCTHESLYLSKHYFLRGYYNKENGLHCFISRDVVKQAFIKLYTSTGVIQIKFTGCNVDISKPIITNFPKFINDVEQTVCVNRGYDFIDEFDYDSERVLNKLTYMKEMCWIDLPAKRCYRMPRMLSYMSLVSTEDTRRAFIIRETTVINKDFNQDFFYGELYLPTEVLCIPSSKIIEYDSLKSQKFVVQHTQGLCFINTISDDTTQFRTIALQNVSGCELRKIVLKITHDGSEDRDDLGNKCDPFYIQNYKMPETLLFPLNTISMKCLELTCTEIIWYLDMEFSVDGVSNFASKLVSFEYEKPEVWLRRNHLLIYFFKAYSKKLDRYFLVSTKKKLQSYILGTGRKFYMPSYGKEYTVCFFKNKIKNFDASKFLIQDSTFACAIVAELKSDFTVQVLNFADCTQNVRLLHDSYRPISDSIDINACLNVERVLYNEEFSCVNETIINLCQTVSCTKINYIAYSNNQIITNVQQIATCSSPFTIQSCLNSDQTFLMLMFTHHQLDEGKFIMREDYEFNIDKNFYYLPIYNKKSFVCFRWKDIKNGAYAEYGAFNKDQNVCIFGQAILKDITISLKVNAFCNRDVLYKNTQDEVQQPERHSKCLIFHRQTQSNVKSVITKLEDVKECLKMLCIEIDYLVTTDDELVDCQTTNCYEYNPSQIKYIKTTIPNENREVYIMPTQLYESLAEKANEDAFYVSGYFDKEIVCINDKILEYPEKQSFGKGVVSLGDGKTCFFPTDLDSTREIYVNLKKKFKKSVKLYKEARNNPRFTKLIETDEKCMKFVTQEEQLSKPISMSIELLKECARLTGFKIGFASLEPVKNNDHRHILRKCPTDEDFCHNYLDNLVYTKINSLYHSSPIYVQNPDSRSISIPERHFYSPSYYSDEVVCFKTVSIKNSPKLDMINSYVIQDHTCILPGYLSKREELKLQTSGNCVRTINLIHDQTRTDTNEKCVHFVKKNKNVNLMSTSEIKDCLKITCSKVMSVVSESEENIHPDYLPITKCDEDDYIGRCLSDGKNYHLVEVENEYVDGPIYFRTIDPYHNVPESKAVIHDDDDEGDTNGKLQKQKIPIYYQPSYPPDSFVCFHKEIMQDVDKISRLDGIFVDTQRICAFSSRLINDVDIKYKVNDKCQLNVKLQSSRNTNTASNDEDLSACEPYLPGKTKSVEITTTTRTDLIRCLNRSCSTIRQVIYKNPNVDEPYSKMVQSCGTESEHIKCMDLIESAEVVEISSPFRGSRFYTSTKEKEAMDVSSPDNHYYKDEYNAGEIVCFQKSMITSDISQFARAGIIQSKEKVCFVVNDLPKDINLQISQFNKCSKTINLKSSSNTKSVQSSVDPCSAFYSKTDGIQSITKAVLKQCLIQTCSQLISLVSDTQNGNELEKIIANCNDIVHGDISCIENDGSYYFAKVKNPSLPSPIYFKIGDAQINVNQKDSTQYFYRSEYDNESVVCFESSKIENSLIGNIAFELGGYKCVVINELAKPIDLRLKNGPCDRSITLNPSKLSVPSESLQMDADCVGFRTILETPSVLSKVSMSLLQKCLRHTCSKIVGSVSTDEPFSVRNPPKYVTCTSNQNNEECLDQNKAYDLIKIENPYTQKPLFFRTKDQSEITPSGSKKAVIYNSIYSKDDFVCFENEKIVIPERDKIQSGIFSAEKQTCIIAKELSSGIQVSQELTPSCSNKISFSNVPSPKQEQIDRDLQRKCSVFFNDQISSDTIIYLPSTDILSCLKRTCSSISNIASMTTSDGEETFKTCLPNQTEEQCLKSILNTDTLLISSPFLSSSIKIRKSDQDEDLYKSATVPSYYDKKYYANQVLCVRNSDLVYQESVLKLKGSKKINDNVCIIVKNLQNSVSIDVKQYGKCQKSIFLNHNTLESSDESKKEVDECEAFYSSSVESHKVMSMDALKKCVTSTCSKIEYYIPANQENQSPILRKDVCDSDSGNIDCLAAANGIYFAKVSSGSRDGPLTITTDSVTEINGRSYDKFYYKDDPYTNQVICIEKSKIIELSLYDDTKSFGTESHKCIVPSELEENAKIKLRTKSECVRVIKILPKSTEKMEEDSICSLFYTLTASSNSVNTISMQNLQRCLSKTCSHVVSAVELASNQPLIQSKLINCGSSISCLNHEKVYDFIKIENDYLTNPVYFRTFDPPTTNLNYLPVIPFLYNNQYYKNDLVCFLSTNSPFQPSQQVSSGIFVERDRTCVIVSDFQEGSSLKVDLRVINDCNHEITFTNSIRPEGLRDKSESMRDLCPHFFEDLKDVKDMPILPKKDLTECLKYSCSAVESFIKLENDNEVYSMKVLTSCTQTDGCLNDVDHYENLQIKSPYSTSKFVLRSKEFLSSHAVMSKTTRYQDSYSSNDVVCIHQNLFLDVDLVKSLKSVFKKHDAYCLVSKDLDRDTVIEIYHYEKCRKILTFNPSSPLPSSQTCQSFDTSSTLVSVGMTHGEFLKCVEETCSKIEYYFSDHDDSTDQRNRKIQLCSKNNGVPDCMNDERKYQISKVSTPLDSPIIFKFEKATTSIPINADESLKSTRYLYKSDYFEEDLLCVPTKSLQDNPTISSSNSYTVEDETCIIVKELSQKATIQSISNECTQTINLFPKATEDEKSQANELYKRCEKFYRRNNSRIEYIPDEDMKKCLKFTCSSVESYREYSPSSRSNSMVGKLVECPKSTLNDECLRDDKLYDFVEVNSGFLDEDIHFRTKENFEKEPSDPDVQEHYDSDYYDDDLVCFETSEIKDISALENTKGVFIEEDRTCVSVKDLPSNVVIEYQVTETCSMNITLHMEENPEKIIDPTPTKCSHFLKLSEFTGILPAYSKDQLLECLSKTCSRIVGFVARDGVSEHFVSRKIKECDEIESPEDCLKQTEHFEALEVECPMLEENFYVQSADVIETLKEVYINENYNNSYYSDEVVCAHQDLIKVKGSMISMKVMYEKGLATCFIVKESSDGDTFTIKNHGYCDKTIKLVSELSSSARVVSPLSQECAMFYSKNTETVKMSFSKLKKCLQFTCSNVDYYVEDAPFGGPSKQSFEACSTLFGQKSCLDSTDSPYVAKIRNPTSSSPNFFINSESKPIDTDSLAKTFYKSQYNKNEMACFKDSMLVSKYHELAMPSLQKDVKCIAANDVADNEKITMKMQDGCEKEITFDKSVSKPGSSSIREECNKFLKDPTGPSSVSTIDKQTLRMCIEETCSKVESLFEADLDNRISTSNSPEKCETINGNSSCLNASIDYDFVKVSNSFLTKPRLFRTYETPVIPEEPKEFPFFFSSVYSGDDVVCFNKSQVLNLDELQDEWIYKEESRICVSTSDVKSKTEVKLQVTDKGSRTITFTPEDEVEKYTELMSNDKLCSRFFEEASNLVTLSLDQLQICKELTNSEFMNEDMSKLFTECLSSDSDKCQSQAQSMMFSLTSPYKNDPILSTLPELDSLFKNLIHDPSRYSLMNTNEHISCMGGVTTDDELPGMTVFVDPFKGMSCFEFDSDGPEFLFTYEMPDKSKLNILDPKKIHDQLIPAYMIHLDIYIFDSDHETVTKTVSAKIPFVVLENKIYEKNKDFDSCISSDSSDNLHINANYTSFIRGYVAAISKNNILLHDLNINVKRKRVCVGYMNNSDIVNDEKQNLKQKTKPRYECLPVFNDYLAYRYNVPTNYLNATERLDKECLDEDSLEKMCAYFYEFTEYITICYGKGKSIDNYADSSEVEDESKLFDIHIFLNNNECYTEKVVLTHRVGFCEIKDGYVKVSLFSYDSFKRAIVRKSMISSSYESTLFVVFVLALGLMVSFRFISFSNYQRSENSDLTQPPLVILAVHEPGDCLKDL